MTEAVRRVTGSPASTIPDFARDYAEYYGALA